MAEHFAALKGLIRMAISTPVPLTRSKARNSLLINLLVFPGIGSLWIGRWRSGIPQVLLSLAGFLFTLVYILRVVEPALKDVDQAIEAAQKQLPVACLGFLLVGIAWLWSLATGLLAMRDARRAEGASTRPPLP